MLEAPWSDDTDQNPTVRQTQRPPITALVPKAIPPDIGSVTADGTYEIRGCYNPIADRGAAEVIPPHRNAQPWKPSTAGAIARNDALQTSSHSAETGGDTCLVTSTRCSGSVSVWRHNLSRSRQSAHLKTIFRRKSRVQRVHATSKLDPRSIPNAPQTTIKGAVATTIRSAGAKGISRPRPCVCPFSAVPSGNVLFQK